MLNLNVVYGLFDGPYDLDISASGLSDDQVDDIVFDNDADDASELERTDIVGMDFSGVPAGNYEFTVSVADGDGEATVPIEVTGDEGATNETNETTTETTTETNETVNETTTETTTAATTNESANGSTSNETMGNETMSNETMANATDDASGNASIVASPVERGQRERVPQRLGRGGPRSGGEPLGGHHQLR